VERTLLDWAEAAAGATPSEPSEELLDALADDLNTARVLAELHSLRKAGDGAAMLAGLDLLGIRLPELAAPAAVAPEVERLIAARLDARRAKNFAESDRIRDELAAMGITLKDGKHPTTGEPTTTWEVKR
jgi:cysteinyl-tRNA synthetase